MIDPLVSLSFTIQRNKGVYALLLGSGVSRSAGIPTGWEIVLDLCSKLAITSGEEAGSDASQWFITKYGKSPDYCELIENLCKTPAERQQLLRGYFEATESQREQGLKQPTEAHRAIAKLVAQGFIRVIVTTNFDRLLERAFEEQGVAPVIINSADATEGALPLAHQSACIIKLHGDYLDSRIKNTPTELATYDYRLDKLLDKVLDQFGLVVCGWSGQWDTALRDAIWRSPCRRFTLFWAAHGKPSTEAGNLIASRNGTIVDIRDADSFFSKVLQLVEGIEQGNRSHPQTVEAVIVLAKRLLSDPNQIINLSDFIHDETENALKSVAAANERIMQSNHDKGEVVNQATELHRNAIERVQALAIQGGAWGGTVHIELWPRIIERLAAQQRVNTDLPEWLQFYSSMLLIYSIGLAAVSQNKLINFREVLYRSKYRVNSQSTPLLVHRFWGQMHDPFNSIHNKMRYTPICDHLYKVLREPLRRFLPSDEQYDDIFDFVEYLIALTYIDLDKNEHNIKFPWPAMGRFTWKGRYSPRNQLIDREDELKTEGINWMPLKVGFFTSKRERAEFLQRELREFVNKYPHI